MTSPSPLPEPRSRIDRSNETTLAGISWLKFTRCRQDFQARWPSVFRLPLLHSHFDLVASQGLNIQSVLDVGATDRMHKGKIESLWPGVDYRSFDIDRTNPHDYHDFADVDRQFDMVTIIEVLEHVPHKVALELLTDCMNVLRPGGWLLASVPNVYAPGVQHEWTHVSSIHYLDLAGLVAWSGCEVLDQARVYYGSRKNWLVHARILHPLHRLLGVDYAQSVVVLGQKPL